MHELMMSTAGRTALRSVLILAIFLASWNAARVAGKRLEQRRNSLHVRFAVSCAKGLIAIAAVAAFCMQFSMTREFALTLFQSASLMVAVIGFAAQAVLADVIAGMVLSFAKPFDTGERIVLEDMGIAGHRGNDHDASYRDPRIRRQPDPGTKQCGQQTGPQEQ